MRIACYIPCAVTYCEVQSVLGAADFECCHFLDEATLLLTCRRQRFDLILADTERLNSSLLSAWLGCGASESTPLILLSSGYAAHDVAHALNSGAEDFIRRPFAGIELLARVQVVLRRQRKANHQHSLEMRGFCLDRGSLTLYDRGTRVLLTPREFSLAWLFFSNLGSYLSRETLSTLLWGVDEEISKHTIEQHVYLLRKKLNLGAERGVRLRTAYNKGYRLELADEAEPAVPARRAPAKKNSSGAIAAKAAMEQLTCALFNRE